MTVLWGARDAVRASMVRLFPRLGEDATPISDVVAPRTESGETVETDGFPVEIVNQLLGIPSGRR